MEDLRENLDEFVEQTDYCLLVVSCTADEGLYVSTLLGAMDETRPDSCFWVFVDPFEDAPQYVNALVASLQRQLDAGSAVRTETCAPSPRSASRSCCASCRNSSATLRRRPSCSACYRRPVVTSWPLLS
jgi:hypothetical protein